MNNENSKNQNSEVISGVKAFDQNFKCKDFQFEPGKTYTHSGKVEICQSGFHFCENPLDVLNYYPPTSKFAEVKGSGGIQKYDIDSKVACKTLSVGAEINLKSLIDLTVKFIFKKNNSSKNSSATTGDRANSATTGDRANSATTGHWANSATTGHGANSTTTGNWANSATTGDRANSATTGDRANSATTGENCISAGLGIKNKAKANLNSWIVLSEWVLDSKNNWIIKTVKSAKVDGKKIKANTWYKLENKEFVETDDKNY